MKLTLITLLIVVTTFTHAQVDTEKISDSIVKEAKRLYRSEMASWYGTDLFMEKFKDQLSNARGYFSYDEGKHTNCIFFSKDETPKVLATFTFDSTFSTATAKIDDKQRDFTPGEKDIYAIRKLALQIIQNDTFFKRYENSNFNLVPLVENRQKKVYVLTGPQSNGVMIIGNDYLLTFDDQNELATKKRLHKTMLEIKYDMKDSETTAMHTHLPETGDFMTATDICTTMLYQKYAKWKQHYVMSKNYVSIWNCEQNRLVVLTKEAWDKMSKDNN